MSIEYKPLNKELANRCHAGTSFSPEKRGEQEIQGHKKIFDELSARLGDFFEQKHADKLHALWSDYLSSHAGVLSPMITGPARFPVDRNNKRCEWADNKRKAIWEYCDNLKSWKAKAAKRDRIEAAGGELEVKKAELAHAQLMHSDMKSINKAIKSALKKEGGMTREDIESFKILYQSLGEDAVEKACRNDSYYGYGYQSFTLTNSNARIKGMRSRVAELERREAAKESGVKPEEFEIDGGKIVYDYAENRINVVHEEKPSREIINTIKAQGFRWSRNFGTWTRPMTPNAKYSAEQLKRELAKKED